MKLTNETLDDARLVQLGLDGNGEAFGQLVARYQSPICALAYSACGDISRSQDLAQETFIVAWRKLGDLKEPGKFKPWLHGIMRNLLNAAFRRQVRDPMAGAEPLEADLTLSAQAASPDRQAISKEEEGMLWRALEQIPEAYREPIVLFYREQQSLQRVAEILDLSEEAARQRLSRGRKLLQEQVLAFIAGALERSQPGAAFTLCVLAALPAMTVSTQAATVGTLAAKGGTSATGAGVGAGFVGLIGAVLCPLLAFLNLFGVWRLNHLAARSDRERKVYRIFYLVLAVSIVTVIGLTTVLTAHSRELIATRPGLFVVLVFGLMAGYPLFLAPFCLWFSRAIGKLGREQAVLAAAPQAVDSFWEYRSRWELLGLPLIHLRTGGWQRGRAVRELRPVKAWIAADDGFAIGVVFAYGAVAVAPISVGACAIGLVSYGAFAIGMLAVGGCSFGGWAFGAIAFGWEASAGCAIAWHIASGAREAIAHDYAYGPLAHAAQVNDEVVKQLVHSSAFFQGCLRVLPWFPWLMWLWSVPMMVSMGAHWLGVVKRRKVMGGGVGG
jgi:RNA polymerase sigma factor (sigma-70 family)